MSLAVIVLMPLLGAVLPPLMIRAGRDTCAMVAAAVPVLALTALLFHLPALRSGVVVAQPFAWLPEAGLDLDLFLDPLGALFAGLILAIGILVIAYARFYLDRSDPLGKLLGLLLLFQGSMLGIALSDNVLLLLVFWELTSLASFLLIGYWAHREDARDGALTALLVTGGGGLALLAGVLLLGEAAGSYRLTEILARAERIRQSSTYLPALLLVLVGAFTKSAQVPFHFWLPRAMAAPTPVSAYLHSATMVKAGVFLLARLWPALAGTDAWFLVVSLTGLVTMVTAAWAALARDDLKAILAYSTVSHLGLMTMLLGLGTVAAVAAAMLHLVNHACFKAALFMTAGIVEHETGTRDARRLGGLAVLMPITGTLLVVDAAAMAGVPLLNGFVSKEAMLEAAFATDYAGQRWLFPLAAAVGALLSAAYAARLALGVAAGRRRSAGAEAPHDPPPGLWLPAAVLTVPVVLFGLAPALLQPLLEAVTGAVTGGPAPSLHLALWHGTSPVLLVSLAALAGGVLLQLGRRHLVRLQDALPALSMAQAFDAGLRATSALSRSTTTAVQTGSLPRYLAWVLVVAIGLGAYGYATGALAPGRRPLLPVTAPALVIWLLILASAGMMLRWHANRLLGLVLVSVIGLMVSLAFLHLSAPDLALTQISVEVVTTILMLLALNYLPKTTPPARPGPMLVAHGAIALAAGAGAAWLLWLVLTRDLESVLSAYYVDTAQPLGGGTNIVNVILVDYRGYDTFGEIIVLAIAALTIAALLGATLRGEAGRRLLHGDRPARAAEAHPLLLVVATRALLPFALLVAAHIFLRGHNQPGGGFVAGLVVGIALLMQYLASSFAWAAERLRMDYHGLIGAGVTVAGLTGLGACLAGLPFLTSTHGHLHVPLLGDVALASAALFDLGVFLTVVGVVMLSLAGLSRIGRAAEQAEDDSPMDTPTAPGPDGRLVVAAGP